MRHSNDWKYAQVLPEEGSSTRRVLDIMETVFTVKAQSKLLRGWRTMHALELMSYVD